MPNRRNLVIVRAGDGSLHPDWLNRPGEERNWDLIVSYWGDSPEMYRGGDWLRIDGKGLKFQALNELVHTHGELVRKYDYVWVTEDDLACTCRDIDRFFDICREERLDLAQPALTQDSYFSHTITLESPCFRLRYTSFVENMAPCFSAGAFVKVTPTLKDSLCGYGLEEVWVMLLGEEGKVAIVDEIQMRHTRPIGGGQLYKALGALGKTGWDEMDSVFAKYGITRRRFWTRSAIAKSGKRVPDGFRFLGLYMWGLLLATPRLKVKRRELPHLWLSAVYQQIKGRKR
ncbi:MAG: DUF707 domain-containing protein [Bryobacteraceae bacterium]